MPKIQGAFGSSHQLFSRLINDRIHRLLQRQRSQLRDPWLPGATNLRLLLRGFLADCCTLVYRTRCRWHAYPMAYAAKLGPIYRRDASGDLRACTLAPGYTKDIENFEDAHPGATVFDLELFYRGWEKGSEWALCNCDRSRRLGMARSDYAPEYGHKGSTE